jgi:hypothetical protein
LCNRWSN